MYVRLASQGAQCKSVRAQIHMDLDAFYAQTEEIRDPSLRQRPLAVTQKCALCELTHSHTVRRQSQGLHELWTRGNLVHAAYRIAVLSTCRYLCVTSNYVARRHGVSKLMSIRDAQACCPALVLVSGQRLALMCFMTMHVIQDTSQVAVVRAIVCHKLRR